MFQSMTCTLWNFHLKPINVHLCIILWTHVCFISENYKWIPFYKYHFMSRREIGRIQLYLMTTDVLKYSTYTVCPATNYHIELHFSLSGNYPVKFSLQWRKSISMANAVLFCSGLNNSMMLGQFPSQWLKKTNDKLSVNYAVQPQKWMKLPFFGQIWDIFCYNLLSKVKW